MSMTCCTAGPAPLDGAAVVLVDVVAGAAVVADDASSPEEHAAKAIAAISVASIGPRTRWTRGHAG